MNTNLAEFMTFRISGRAKLFVLFSAILFISFNTAIAQSTERPSKVNGEHFMHIKRAESGARSGDCVRLPNRTIDGTCNNISEADAEVWGASDISLRRAMSSAYGLPDYYNDMNGNCRLSARAISNLVCAQTGDILSPRNLSSMVFTWGQFIDHDIDLTPEGETEFVPILLPANEPLFTSIIPFSRSEIYPDSGVSDSRQQQNLITSWLDASQVYGSEESRADWLRTFSQGKLKTSEGDLLPYNTVDGNLDSDIDVNAPSMAGDSDGTNKVFVAGDVRANEQPGLTALHTLFVREHNRICDQLVDQGNNNDEQNYQAARKRVGAYIQAITYNDFLPGLGVNIDPYNGYNPNIQPDIVNLFATAAYRLGHTMVTNEIPLIDEDCDAVEGGSILLLEAFFNPAVVADYGIEPIIQGLASQTQQKVDAKIVDNLRNFLFPTQGGQAFGLDLASLNIQRGRDHGLPDYGAVRSHFTNADIDDFDDITADLDLQAALEAAYGSVYDMDLWVGLLSEDPLPGSSVGITLNAILGQQFEQIRDGDFYFYRNDPAFSGQQRNQISNTSLQDVIRRNTPINSLQEDVFFAASCSPNGGGGGGNGPGGGDGDGGNGGGGGNGNGDGGGGNGNGDGGGGGGGGGGGNGPGGGNLVVFPNPATDLLNIQLELERVSDQVSIVITNAAENQVYRQIDRLADTFIQYQLNLSHLPAGIYVISVQSDTEIFTKKIILNRE